MHLALGPERDVALRLTLLIRAQIVRLCEVHLQRQIVLVEPVLLEFAAKIACQVQLVKVFLKRLRVIKELLAEVAPRMRENLRAALVRSVAVLNMRPQFLNMVNSLLADEDGASL